VYLSRPAAIGVLAALFLLGLAYLYVAEPGRLVGGLVLLAMVGAPFLAGYVYVAEPPNVPISHRAAGRLFVFTVVVAFAVFLYIAQPGYMGPMIAG
jgi:hypothetical protein